MKFVLILSFLAAASGWADDVWERVPGNIQFELVRVGPSLSAIADHGCDLRIDARALHFGVGYGQFRAGVSVAEVMPLGTAVFPVELGFTAVQRPVPYGPFQGMVPDICVLATFLWVTDLFEDRFRGPAGQFALSAEVDRFGVGVGARVGVYVVGDGHGAVITRPAGTAYVRLVTNFRF